MSTVFLLLFNKKQLSCWNEPYPHIHLKRALRLCLQGSYQFRSHIKTTFLHTVWLLISFSFFLNKTIENKQRITLDVRHCLMSHLSFFWLFGFHSILSTLDWNAPTQQNHVLFEFSCSSEDLILIHVILRDGTGPAYSHSECTSALKCLLSPRTQTVRASG